MKTVLEVLDHYKDSVNKQDINEFMKLYDTNVHIFDSWNTWEVNGISNWETIIQDWFSILRSDKSTIVVSYKDLVIEESEGIAYIHAAICYSELNSHQIVFRHLTNRFTIVLRKNESEWKIIHEHSSLPIHSESGKGLFDLK
jgi:ketosteroid isomerase-like protein